MNEEAWKDCSKNPGYQVSSIGRVRSNRRNKHGWTVIGMTKRLGYVTLQWHCNGSVKSDGVHRLVAYEFIPNIYNKPFINHKNGVRDDNRVENLEWCTQSENMLHACRVMGHNSGEKSHWSKLVTDEILEIRTLFYFGASRKDLASTYDVDASTVSRVLARRTWR